MKRDIKDYLHLYLGCEVQIREYSSYGETVFIEKLISCTDEHAGTNQFEYYFDDDNEISFKPILRPLSDMTEEEFDYMFFKQPGYVSIESKAVVGKRFDISPHQVAFLLSKGFDLFGLIAAGLAIDKTTLKQTA